MQVDDDEGGALCGVRELFNLVCVSMQRSDVSEVV
jgi:hypothetical protein